MPWREISANGNSETALSLLFTTSSLIVNRYLSRPRNIAPGATGTADARLFAGAKEVRVVNDYEKKLDLNHFDLLIDWGWFTSSPSRCSP